MLMLIYPKGNLSNRTPVFLSSLLSFPRYVRMNQAVLHMHTTEWSVNKMYNRITSFLLALVICMPLLAGYTIHLPNAGEHTCMQICSSPRMSLQYEPCPLTKHGLDFIRRKVSQHTRDIKSLKSKIASKITVERMPCELKKRDNAFTHSGKSKNYTLTQQLDLENRIRELEEIVAGLHIQMTKMKEERDEPCPCSRNIKKPDQILKNQTSAKGKKVYYVL